jgi:hypothetical protein
MKAIARKQQSKHVSAKNQYMTIVETERPYETEELKKMVS